MIRKAEKKDIAAARKKLPTLFTFRGKYSILVKIQIFLRRRFI